MGCKGKKESGHERQLTAAPATITLPGPPWGPSLWVYQMGSQACGQVRGRPSPWCGGQATYHPLQHNGGLVDCVREGDVRACHGPLVHTATVS